MGQLSLALLLLLMVLPAILVAVDICPLSKLPTEITIDHSRHPMNLALGVTTNTIDITTTLKAVNRDTGEKSPLANREVVFEITIMDKFLVRDETAAGTSREFYLSASPAPFAVNTSADGTVRMTLSTNSLLGQGSTVNPNPKKIQYSITATFTPGTREPLLGSTKKEQYVPGTFPLISMAACLPLLLVAALLVGAMFAAGQNPFGMLDFSRVAFRAPQIRRRAVKGKTWSAPGVVQAAYKAAGTMGTRLLLKGAGTVLSAPGKLLSTAGAAMAKPGVAAVKAKWTAAKTGIKYEAKGPSAGAKAAGLVGGGTVWLIGKVLGGTGKYLNKKGELAGATKMTKEQREKVAKEAGIELEKVPKYSKAPTTFGGIMKKELGLSEGASMSFRALMNATVMSGLGGYRVWSIAQQQARPPQRNELFSKDAQKQMNNELENGIVANSPEKKKTEEAAKQRQDENAKVAALAPLLGVDKDLLNSKKMVNIGGKRMYINDALLKVARGELNRNTFLKALETANISVKEGNVSAFLNIAKLASTDEGRKKLTSLIAGISSERLDRAGVEKTLKGMNEFKGADQKTMKDMIGAFMEGGEKHRNYFVDEHGYTDIGRKFKASMLDGTSINKLYDDAKSNALGIALGIFTLSILKEKPNLGDQPVSIRGKDITLKTAVVGLIEGNVNRGEFHAALKQLVADGTINSKQANAIDSRLAAIESNYSKSLFGSMGADGRMSGNDTFNAINNGSMRYLPAAASIIDGNVVMGSGGMGAAKEMASSFVTPTIIDWVVDGKFEKVMKKMDELDPGRKEAVSKFISPIATGRLGAVFDTEGKYNAAPNMSTGNKLEQIVPALSPNLSPEEQKTLVKTAVDTLAAQKDLDNAQKALRDFDFRHRDERVGLAPVMTTERDKLATTVVEAQNALSNIEGKEKVKPYLKELNVIDGILEMHQQYGILDVGNFYRAAGDRVAADASGVIVASIELGKTVQGVAGRCGLKEKSWEGVGVDEMTREVTGALRDQRDNIDSDISSLKEKAGEKWGVKEKDELNQKLVEKGQIDAGIKEIEKMASKYSDIATATRMEGLDASNGANEVYDHLNNSINNAVAADATLKIFEGSGRGGEISAEFPKDSLYNKSRADENAFIRHFWGGGEEAKPAKIYGIKVEPTTVSESPPPTPEPSAPQARATLQPLPPKKEAPAKKEEITFEATEWPKSSYDVYGHTETEKQRGKVETAPEKKPEVEKPETKKKPKEKDSQEKEEK